MTLGDKIRETVKKDDPIVTFRLVEWLLAGGLVGRTGSSIQFTYFDVRDLFKSCVPGLTDDRFEEMMQEAEIAGDSARQ